jgi:hypothetical protein
MPAPHRPAGRQRPPTPTPPHEGEGAILANSNRFLPKLAPPSPLVGEGGGGGASNRTDTPHPSLENGQQFPLPIAERLA